MRDGNGRAAQHVLRKFRPHRFQFAREICTQSFSVLVRQPCHAPKIELLQFQTVRVLGEIDFLVDSEVDILSSPPG